ncbi:C40 family peptidase [Ructibacterium gallinarum]|uniref:C40 family peptidase n=1 Tax=Ructibacterium gallinarum TaxID=2779355 RepID=A0A9D5R917_9FIRM|nr:NlpC/P60 family protein [Ructibacterium gallinarum]MBE5040557.1 C40 family peptidase [Ructibacterium gallinarum]
MKNNPKTSEYGKNAARDIKAVAKDVLVKNTVRQKADEVKQEKQSERAEVQATESVEHSAYSAVNTVYAKGKAFAQNKIKQHYENKKIQSVSETVNETKTSDNLLKERVVKQVQEKTQNAQVKTKENYLKAQLNTTMPNSAPEMKVKTKQNDIQTHFANTKPADYGNSSFGQANQKNPQQARREYVENKLKTKTEYERMHAENATDITPHTEPVDTIILPKDKRLMQIEATHTSQTELLPKSPVKTKASYMQSLRKEKAENIKVQSNQTVLSSPKEKPQSALRSTANKNKEVKTKQSVSKTSKGVKIGNIYQTPKYARKSANKAKKVAVKTQKEVTKKAAKQAAKCSKEMAQRAAQATKAATRAAVRITVRTAQMVAAAAKAIISALSAFGGWAVLLIVLIIIIIVAAIAASPFGIFISDEAADSDSIPVSSIVAECNLELSARLDEIENGAMADRVEMEGEQANWNEVLAIFAVKVAGTDDGTAEDVVVIDEAKKQKLKAVFWDMNSIASRTETVQNGETSETVLYITIYAKTKDDMIDQYGFTAKQQEALVTLLENSDVLDGAVQSLAISDATAKEVLKSLPGSLAADRKAVIKAACSLVGKVNYFWGGKSSAIGWDSEWGKLKVVSAAGSKTTGTKRPFGLDCSGFVTWSFLNAGKSANAIGHGTQGQIAKCTRISWSAAQPGDLAFLSDLSHVGIVAGRDKNGNVLVIHCSGGANNVVITTNAIFGFAARPNCY